MLWGHNTDRPHMPSDRITLHLIGAVFLLGDPGPFLRMGIGFDERRTFEDLLLRHTYVMEQTSVNYILLRHPYTDFLQFVAHSGPDLRSRQGMSCHTHIFMMRNTPSALKPL